MDSERNFIIINLFPLSNMSELFDICVDILYWIANVTGWTYKEANIWIFVIIHPVITLSLMIWAMKLKIKLIKTAKYETV